MVARSSRRRSACVPTGMMPVPSQPSQGETMTIPPPGPGEGPRPPLPPAPPIPLRPTWTFLTNHGHVLLAVAADPDARINDIAAKVGITPRATLQILKDLDDGGYVHRSRDGRRTRYAIEPHRHFRHPATATREVDGLIGLFADSPPSTAAEPPQASIHPPTP
jgi:hypothetical protein